MHVPAPIDISAIPEDQRDAVAALLRENMDFKGVHPIAYRRDARRLPNSLGRLC